MLKINRKYVQCIPEDEAAKTLIDSVIAMGHSLGMRVTAIGVETEAQFTYLRQSGCDWVQGFMFSGAIKPAEVVLLKKKVKEH